jgi:hypothetical protein
MSSLSWNLRFLTHFRRRYKTLGFAAVSANFPPSPLFAQVDTAQISTAGFLRFVFSSNRSRRISWSWLSSGMARRVVLVEDYRRFRDAYCLHQQSDEYASQRPLNPLRTFKNSVWNSQQTRCITGTGNSRPSYNSKYLPRKEAGAHVRLQDSILMPLLDAVHGCNHFKTHRRVLR